VKYWVTVLTPAEGVASQMNEVGETGWVTGTFTRADLTGGSFLYGKGVSTVLPGDVPWGSGVSDAGEVILTNATSTYVYSGSLGRTTADLGVLGIAPSGIDRTGQVVLQVL